MFGLAVNSEFNYPKYFAMIPTGQNTKPSFTEGFFDVAAKQNPSSTTVAIVAADAEFARNACEGARENVKKHGLKIVYDRKYPPSTTDFTPIVRAIQAANPDVGGDLLLSAGLGRHGAHGQRDRLQAEDDRRRDGRSAGTAIKTQLGPLLNGFVNYETWVPSKQMLTPEVQEFLKEYQSRAKPRASIRSAIISAHGATPISNCSARRSKAAKSLDDNKIAEYMRTNTIKTIMGDDQVRQERRMGRIPACCRSSTRHQGQRPRSVPRHGHADRRRARRNRQTGEA